MHILIKYIINNPFLLFIVFFTESSKSGDIDLESFYAFFGIDCKINNSIVVKIFSSISPKQEVNLKVKQMTLLYKFVKN